MPPEITRERLNFSMSRKVKWRILTKRKDSFGRQYIVWMDRNNLEPTGQIERHFTVPQVAYVPDEFLKFPEDKPWKVEVQWERYALYLKNALREWQAVVKLHMKRLYGAKGVGAEPTPEAIDAAGPPPQDWRVIVLAMRGDPYLLGLTQKVTPAARKILPDEATRVPTKKATFANRELRLDPELEKLLGRTKTKEPEEMGEKDEADLAEQELLADTLRQARELEGPGSEAALDAAEDADLEQFMAEVGADDDEDEGILTGGLSDEDIFDVEESADPGAVGGARVAVGSEKSRAKAKGRVRKAGG